MHLSELWHKPVLGEYQNLFIVFPIAFITVRQVQILSHESKIATRIELFVGHGGCYDSAQFRRLGYLSLNSNEESNYAARELKSVYVDAPGQYLRMLIHKCHINNMNAFNQV